EATGVVHDPTDLDRDRLLGTVGSKRRQHRSVGASQVKDPRVVDGDATLDEDLVGRERTEQIVSVVSPRHPIERSSVDVTDRRERLDARITLDIGHKAVHTVIGGPEIRQPRFADGNTRGEVDTNVVTGVEY